VSPTGPGGYAFNHTRQTFLANRIQLARTHWGRLRGLMGVAPDAFPAGSGLWIVPCHGIHSFNMRFPIDAIYLDAGFKVVELIENLRPWRIAPLNFEAVTVLELPARTISVTGTQSSDLIEIVAASSTGQPAKGRAA
jgi:uncharacterized protein